MSLDEIHNKFIERLENHAQIDSCKALRIAGVSFLYVTANTIQRRSQLEDLLSNLAGNIIKGLVVSASFTFVRENEKKEYVYRFKFLVPQRKMFCCGNGCIDCILFTDN